MSKCLWQIQSRCYHFFRSNPWSEEILRQENRAANALLKSIPMDDIQTGLDIGTGHGNSLALIPAQESLWFSIDYVNRMIQESRSQFPRVQFIVGDIRQLPFESESFDLVLCIGVSEYLDNLYQLMEEIWRALKPAGYLLLTLAPPNIFNFLRQMIGHRIHSRRERHLNIILNLKTFELLQKSHGTMQDQFLLRKTGIF